MKNLCNKFPLMVGRNIFTIGTLENLPQNEKKSKLKAIIRPHFTLQMASFKDTL
jgi:hypothetical protein